MHVHGRGGSVVFVILQAVNLVRRSVRYDKNYS